MNTWTRKDFLKLMAASGVAAGTAGLPLGLGAQQRQQAQEVMRTRAIPSSGEQVPIVGFGTGRAYRYDQDPKTIETMARVVETLFSMGGRMIDTAWVYGHAEANLGDVLERRPDIRKSMFLNTKIYAGRGLSTEAQQDESFTNMGVKQVDLYQVHNLADWQNQLARLREWRQAGLTRYVGLTLGPYSRFDELADIIARHKVDFIQFPYSLARREAEARLLPAARDNGVATIFNRPFYFGRVFRLVKGKALPDWAKDFAQGWGEFFLKYSLSTPGATAAIPSTSEVKHMRDNARAGHGRLPTAGERKRMREFFDSL